MSKRRRASAPVSPSDSPAARRARPAAAESPTLVEVEGKWAEVMQRAREEEKFIDVSVIAGGLKIPAHKNVLLSLSPYLDALLTSGLAESSSSSDEITVGDASTNGRAVEAIIDCFYTGKVALCGRTVSSVRNRWQRIEKGRKLREDGVEMKNRCHACGQPKRGHICTAKLRDLELRSPCKGERHTKRHAYVYMRVK